MDFLNLGTAFQDPYCLPLEMVERKGLGHPDTLADALAELVSMEYSRFCQQHFGVVLHHNIDKLYIGAGHFRVDFGLCEMIKPVQVMINGRMSNSFARQIIDLQGICESTVREYLQKVLPHLQPEQLVVNANATQHTQRNNWFTPMSMEDLPETADLRANDTSICLAHWPFSTAENLAYELESYFWSREGKYPVPRFDHFGQDIKVMVVREGNRFDVTVGVPVISTKVSCLDEIRDYIASAESDLNQIAEGWIDLDDRVQVRINPYQERYMLGIGSCIECGEEGLVGRGNANNGVISVFRPHSMEAWAGKNPVYHTGRVLSFLTMNLAKAIHSHFGVRCTVIAMTKNKGSLIPPYKLSVQTEVPLERGEVEAVVATDFCQVDYLSRILTERQIK